MVFQYLSFQRPPPNKIVVSPTSISSISIPISPLITNDLRSDPFQPPVPIKIQVAWFLSSGQSAPSESRKMKQLGDATEILWEGPLSAYKTIGINLPSDILSAIKKLRPGSQTAELRLGMWVDQVDQDLILSKTAETSSGPANQRPQTTSRHKSFQDSDSFRSSKRSKIHSDIVNQRHSGSSFKLSNGYLAFDLTHQGLEFPNDQVLPVVSGSIQLAFEQIAGSEMQSNETSAKKKPKQSKGKSKTDDNSSTKEYFQLQGKQDRLFRFFSLVSEDGSVENGDLPVKQDREDEEVGMVRARRARDLTLEIQEITGFELDKHIWDASLHLVRFLSAAIIPSRLPTDATSTTLLTILTRKFVKSMRIVELGSGTGLVSIALCALLSSLSAGDEDSTMRNFEIFATDLPSALPLLESNLALNSHLFKETGSSINQADLPSTSLEETSKNVSDSAFVECKALTLDWEEALPFELPSGKEGENNAKRDPLSDLVLISDCTYNPAFFAPLLDTVVSLLSSSQREVESIQSTSLDPANHSPTSEFPKNGAIAGSELEDKSLVIISKKHRHEDEETFWIESEKRGLIWNLVKGRAGWDRTNSTSGEIEMMGNEGNDLYGGWGIWIGWLK